MRQSASGRTPRLMQAAISGCIDTSWRVLREKRARARLLSRALLRRVREKVYGVVRVFSVACAVWLAVKQRASPPGTGHTRGNVPHLLARLKSRPLRFPEFASGPAISRRFDGALNKFNEIIWGYSRFTLHEFHSPAARLATQGRAPFENYTRG